MPLNAGVPRATAGVLPLANNSFLEGPVWFEGNLYLSQLGQSGSPAPGQILRLNGSDLEVVSANVGTNGLAFNQEGFLVAASQKSHGLILLDPATPNSAALVFIDEYENLPFNSPNDLTLRSNGNVYFTDPAWNCGGDCPRGNGLNQKFYRVSPSREVTSYETGSPRPNGISLSPDESTLYIGGSQQMVSLVVAEDGSLSSPTDFGPPGDSDGLAVDCSENIYVTRAMGGMTVHSADGSQLGQVATRGSATNVAFGGERGTTAFVTSGRSLYAFETDIPGSPY